MFMSMENTGERMIPEFHEKSISYAEHINRYLFAIQHVPGKIVLDIACGSGYGTAMIANAGARRVIGIDKSTEAIYYAREVYGKNNIEWIVSDAENISLNDESIDVVVSFETLEHVYNPREFLSECTRILKQDGIFICSTPNNKMTLGDNEFHTHEYSLDEYRLLLENFFQYNRIYYQGEWFSTAILDACTMLAEGLLPLDVQMDQFKIARENLEKAHCFISISSKGYKMPENKFQHVFSHTYEVADMIRYMKKIEKNITEKDTVIRFKSEELKRIYSSMSWKIGNKLISTLTFPVRCLKFLKYKIPHRLFIVAYCIARDRGLGYLFKRAWKYFSPNKDYKFFSTISSNYSREKDVAVSQSSIPDRYRLQARVKKDLIKKIGYLLPSFLCCGGNRIIFEHANRLSERGYEIYLIAQENDFSSNWFNLDSRIRKVDFYSFKDWAEDVDAIVATYHLTLRYILDLPEAIHKFYFIQSDERKFYQTIHRGYFECEETYRVSGIHFFTEAQWIQKWLKQEFQRESTLVPNKINFEHFYPEKTVESNKTIILIEGNANVAYKGVEEAFITIRDLPCEKWLLTNSVQQLPSYTNGFDRIYNLPDQDMLRRVISSADIMIKPSYFEGSPLPHMEAMTCGTALITTIHDGSREHCLDGYNCLMVNPGDGEGLKKAALKLFFDLDFRKTLIKNGLEYAKANFNWEESIDLLEKMFSNVGNKKILSISEKEFMASAENGFLRFSFLKSWAEV